MTLAPSGNDMVFVSHLTVSYNNQGSTVYALDDISFAVPKGGTCAVIGPSGSGKSTLLYVLSGLLDNFSGEVIIDGGTVIKGRLRTALILQDYGLLPWKRVWDNAALGLAIRGVSQPEIKIRITSILKELGLWELQDRFPSQISGGQRQRTGIARALALDPDLLLMDEPFSALDALTRESLQQQLLQIWSRGKMTIVLVTHSIEEAIFLGQKILILSPTPGRVRAIVDNPRAGQGDYRKTKEFYEMATKVRGILESDS